MGSLFYVTDQRRITHWRCLCHAASYETMPPLQQQRSRPGGAMGPTQIAVRTRYIIKTQTLWAQSVTTSWPEHRATQH